MKLDEWIKCLEGCLKELKIPEVQNAKDWESLYKMLQELKERREAEQWLKVRGYYRSRYKW